MEALVKGPRYPAREFIRSGATFGEVYAMAAVLRAALADPQYQGTTVCLAVENKAVMAAAMLASLAGGPSLLLPYAFSAGALERMQRLTGFTTAITDTVRHFPQGVKTITLHPGDGEADQLEHPTIRPDAELLKIFTGGSTGTPQVWSKTCGNIFGEGGFLAHRFKVNPRDCIMATVPPYHIYGLLFTVILPLVSSATVVDETPSFPNEIVRVVDDRQVTMMASVPAHYRALGARDLSLRLAFSSAGMLDQEDNERFCRQNRSGIVEVYGSTETGGIATRNRSIGEASFTPFSTIDWKTNNTCLAIRSPYISPDLSVDGEGFFTANDRVEVRGATTFSLKGRVDTVIKVGGKRVDLEEVCALIKKRPGVVDCIVTALPERGGRENRIGALIQGETVDVEQIKKTLAHELEPYALPRCLKIVEHLPVKQNGKYDREAIVRYLDQ